MPAPHAAEVRRRAVRLARNARVVGAHAFGAASPRRTAKDSARQLAPPRVM